VWCTHFDEKLEGRLSASGLYLAQALLLAFRCAEQKWFDTPVSRGTPSARVTNCWCSTHEMLICKRTSVGGCMLISWSFVVGGARRLSCSVCGCTHRDEKHVRDPPAICGLLVVSRVSTFNLWNGNCVLAVLCVARLAQHWMVFRRVGFSALSGSCAMCSLSQAISLELACRNLSLLTFRGFMRALMCSKVECASSLLINRNGRECTNTIPSFLSSSTDYNPSTNFLPWLSLANPTSFTPRTPRTTARAPANAASLVAWVEMVSSANTALT